MVFYKNMFVRNFFYWGLLPLFYYNNKLTITYERNTGKQKDGVNERLRRLVFRLLFDVLYEYRLQKFGAIKNIKRHVTLENVLIFIIILK